MKGFNNSKLFQKRMARDPVMYSPQPELDEEQKRTYTDSAKDNNSNTEEYDFALTTDSI